MSTEMLQHLIKQVEGLSPEEQLRLIALSGGEGTRYIRITKTGTPMGRNLGRCPLSLAGRGRTSVDMAHSA